MLERFKQKVLEIRLNSSIKKYNKECGMQKDRYAMWILEHEAKGSVSKVRPEKEKKQYAGLTMDCFCYSDFEKAYESSADIILFYDADGVFELGAKEKIAETFLEDGKVKLVYGDEDCICKNGMRGYPWFKPDFSPDTLLSFFYLGSYFAVRRTDLLKVPFVEGTTVLEGVYDFVLRYVQSQLEEHKHLNISEMQLKINHIREILFHKKRPDYEEETGREWSGFGKEFEYGFEQRYTPIKLKHLKKIGLLAEFLPVKDREGVESPYFSVRYQVKNAPLVSIVIPTKDHPEILERCISSIREKTTYENYEIIVVDNGSNAENKERIEQLAQDEKFYYHHETMEFNFSRMCNIGVSYSKGEVILLLNDDMEIIQKDWMEILLGQAMLSECGCVGAKLLYPESDKIQHVGITNMGVGPSHKLIHLSDSEDYYYGRNHLNYNMIGVTAACLMIRKEIYDQVGGLSEEIKVAYNDAEFCMRVYEAGFMNVLRNDVILYHHESLSRGDDRMDDAKLTRLLTEKEMVRSLHEKNMEDDPFYSCNLAGYRVPYDCSYQYPYEKHTVYNRFKKGNGKDFTKWENNCLTIFMDHYDVEAKTDIRDMKDIVLIEGWAYVLGMDNARYKRSLILTNVSTSEMVLVPVMDRYRKDVAEILPNETNVDLAGFVVRLEKNILSEGEWNIGLLASDCCSRQKLYKKCEEVLVIQ